MPTVPPRNKPGAYRRKLAIQKPGSAQSQYGNTVPAWVDVQNPIWGNVTYYKGNVSVFAAGVQGQEIYMIECRYRPGIDKTMRVLDLTTSPQREYKIIGINDVDERHEKLSITAVLYQ